METQKVYSKNERLRLLDGLDPISDGQKHGYWTEFQNLEFELLLFISKEGREGIMPTRRFLYKCRRHDLIDAIKRHGGYPVVADRIGLQHPHTPKPSKPASYWNEFVNVEQELRDFIKGHDLGNIMPTQRELVRAGHSSIAAALPQHGGAYEVARRLGLEIRSQSRKPS